MRGSDLSRPMYALMNKFSYDSIAFTAYEANGYKNNTASVDVEA